MIELQLLGVNGDVIVMTNADGERYTLVIDDALRAAVRRDRQSVEASAPGPGTPVRPRDLQSLMRAGASAEEVAGATGLPLEHVSKYQGPVLAERAWAVAQARDCRIGWERDSPVLGDLVVDRLATRGVDASHIEWDAVRQGRDPWEVTVTFVQGAEEKEARWVLDLSTRSVTALDDEARWLTETASSSRRPAVFDQDSQAPGASAHGRRAASAPEPSDAPAVHEGDPATGSGTDTTDALLADLADARGRRQGFLKVPLEVESAAPAALPQDVGEPTTPAQIVSMSAHRRGRVGNHPAGSRLPAPEESEVATRSTGHPAVRPSGGAAPAVEVEHGSQDSLPDMPEAPEPRPRRRARRSVPSWDEIVFGARPE